MDEEVVDGLETAVSLSELFTAGGTNYCAAEMQNATHTLPIHQPYLFATIYHALIAFIDGIHFGTFIQSSTDNGANCGVHAWRVASAC